MKDWVRIDDRLVNLTHVSRIEKESTPGPARPPAAAGDADPWIVTVFLDDGGSFTLVGEKAEQLFDHLAGFLDVASLPEARPQSSP